VAITVDWPTKVINIPKADLLLIQSTPTEIRQLDMDAFRLILRGLEDNPDSAPYDVTHTHNPPVTVSGAALARVVQLINSYTVTFESGSYAVNVVGANTNLGDVTNVNNVSVRTSNSAGLQDLNSLQAASFGGVVAIDPNSIYAGTVFPVGTRGFPVNNVNDATTIAAGRGIRTVLIMGSMTLSSGDFSAGYKFRADNLVGTTVNLDPGTNVTGCEFEHMTITGTLDGSNSVRGCVVQNLNYVNGQIRECALEGSIMLGGSAQLSVLDCWSNVASEATADFPLIDMGGTGNSIVVRNYAGGLRVSNGDGPLDVHSFDFNSGELVLESTITDGTYHIHGICEVVNNSTGAATVVDETITRVTAAIEADLEGELVTTSTLDGTGNGTGTMILYTDATRTTILRQWTTVYTGYAVTERIPA